MTVTIEATWKNGVLHPSEPVTLPEGSAVRIDIHVSQSTPDPLASVIGIADGPSDGRTADEHDRVAYDGRTP